jgi:hypothetical protein
MSKRGIFVSICLLLIIMTTVLVIGVGPAEAGAFPHGISSVGRLPDSPVYFITSWKRSITSLFTFGAQDEAMLALKYANEDILAIDTLFNKGECQIAEKHCNTFQEDFQKAARLALKTRFEDSKRDAAILIEALKQSNLWQRDVLANVLCNTSDDVSSGFLDAMDNSSLDLGNTIEGVYGADEKEAFLQELNPFNGIPVIEIAKVDQDANNINNYAETDSDSEEATAAELREGTLSITSLKTDDDKVNPGDKCHIECIAVDENDNSLSYEWSASDGEIDGEGSDIRWIAPDKAGKYRISITVSNVQGDSVSDSLKIEVLSVDPPEIEQIIVIPYDPQYFVVQPFSKRYVILQRKSCELECVLENSGEYDYEWSTSQGSISGNGDTVTWTAPSGKVVVTVTVKVSDGNGNTVKQEIIFDVRTCAPCFL